MKRFSEQLHKKSMSVKLRAAEKRDLEERLHAYMEYHPLPSEMKVAEAKTVKKKVERIATDAFVSVSIPWQNMFKTGAVMAVMVMMIVPYAAEKAIPGDTLYAVKVKFNEEVRGTLTFDAYEKVEWETERLNRRIAEARLLASEGKLTEEVEAEVADAVREHTASAQREIAELREQDNDAATIASISLDTTLEFQSDAFQSEETDADGEAVEEVNLIVSAIEESRTLADEDTSTSTLPAFDRTMAKVEQNTTRVYELLATLQPIVSEEEHTDLIRRIEDVERALAEVIEIRTTNEDQGRVSLIEVLQSSQRLIVYMTEVEVANTVNIEEIIPVVLTDEEKVLNHDTILIELADRAAQMDDLITRIEDADILLKVEITQGEINLALEELATGTPAYTDFVASSTALQIQLDELIPFLEQHASVPVPEPEPVIEGETDGETGTTTDEVIEDDLTNPPIDIEDGNGSTTEDVVEEPQEEPEPEVEEATTTEETI